MIRDRDGIGDLSENLTNMMDIIETRLKSKGK